MTNTSDTTVSSTIQTDQQALDDWAKTQNQEAFTALVQRHAGFVLAVSQRILGQGQQSDDVVQAAFLMLSREAGNIRAHSLRTWLHRTTVRAALMQLRSERSRRDREKLAMADAPTEVAEVMDDAWEVLRPHIDQALDALPNAQRTIMVRHIMHGEKLVDLAVSLGQKPDAVRKQRDRAIVRLRSWFEKRGICASTLIVAVERPIPAAEVPKNLFETCSHITTAPSPGALAIVKGMQTAMIIKTTLVTAGLGLLGTFVGGLGYMAFFDQNPNVPTPHVMRPHIEQHQDTKALSATHAENLEWRAWTIATKATPYGSFSPDGKYFLWSPLEPSVPDKGSSIHAWSLDDGLDHVRIADYREYFRKADDHTQSDPNTCWQSGPLACDNSLQHFVVQQTKPGLGAGLSWWMRIPALQGNHPPGEGQSAPIAAGSWPGPSLVAEKNRNERTVGTYRLVPGRSKDGHFAIHDPVTGDIRIFQEKPKGGFTVQALPFDKKKVGESNEVFWNGTHLGVLVSESRIGGTKLEVRDLWSSDGSPLEDPVPLLGHYMLEESLVMNSDTLEPARIIIRSLDPHGYSHEVCYQASTSADRKSWKETWSLIDQRTSSSGKRKMLAWDFLQKQVFRLRNYEPNSDKNDIYFDHIVLDDTMQKKTIQSIKIDDPQSWFAPLRTPQHDPVSGTPKHFIETVRLLSVSASRALIMVERIGYGTNFQRHVGRLMLFENTEVPRLDPVSIQTEGEVFSWETSGKIPAPNGLSGAPTIVTHPSGAVALFLPKTQQWRLIHLGIVPKLGWRVVEKAGLVRQTPDSNSQLITSDGLHGIAVSGMVFPGSTVNVIAVNKDWCTVSVGAMTGYLHRMALERSK